MVPTRKGKSFLQMTKNGKRHIKQRKDLYITPFVQIPPLGKDSYTFRYTYILARYPTNYVLKH
jgi:hypothetical protein